MKTGNYTSPTKGTLYSENNHTVHPFRTYGNIIYVFLICLPRVEPSLTKWTQQEPYLDEILREYRFLTRRVDIHYRIEFVLDIAKSRALCL
jgi:hypothetical protein